MLCVWRLGMKGFGNGWKFKIVIPLPVVVFLASLALLTQDLVLSPKSVNAIRIFALETIGGLSVLILCFLVVRKIRLLLLHQKLRGYIKSKFRTQVLWLFSSIAVLPAICIFVFSTLFFNVGVENLFKNPVRKSIENSEKVADIYINEAKVNLENFAINMRYLLALNADLLLNDHVAIKRMLEQEATDLKVAAAVMQFREYDREVIASTLFAKSLEFIQIPENFFYTGSDGVTTWEVDGAIVSAAAIDSECNFCLIVSTPVDSLVLDCRKNMKEAIGEYKDITSQRTGLKISFMLFFGILVASLLLLSVFVALIFANRVTRPVNDLINATDAIAAGSYGTKISLRTRKNEFDKLIAVFNDMSQKLQEQRQQLLISSRQNTWRDIARRIAHEIKNPLTPIQLSAERLRSKYRKEISTNPEIFSSCIDTIVRQVHCIGNLVKEFSDFARMPEPKIERTDVTKLVNEVVLIQSNAHKNIEFKTEFFTEKCFCHIDPSQINQALINVIQNAANAINESTQKDKGCILVRTSADSASVFISVEDNGSGFSPAAIEKAFEPYFTTRDAGTGLGLAIVYKILTDHNGKITLGKSETLGGAKVLMEIPKNFVEKEKENGI